MVASGFLENPYITGRPVEAREMFFGRQDVFDFVRRNLIGQYQDNAIVLYGEPRTGKTSVLKQMHHHLGQSHVCVYIDLEGMALDGVGNFLWQVADAIWRALQADGIELKQPLVHEFTREQKPRHYFADVFLKRVEEVLKERRLLLMFDEAMLLRDAMRARKLESDIFPYLSHLLQHYPVANFIFSIGGRPREIDREFAQAFRAALYKEISFLEWEAALELINRPVKGLFEYSQSATEAILRLTSGHPYFIQLICHSLFNRWQEQRRDMLDSGDVQEVLDEVVEMSRSHMLNMWEEELAAEEKAVLAVLAELISDEQDATRQAIDHTVAAHGWLLAPGQVTSALQSLSESNVISPFEPYFFRVDLFRMWIRDHRKVEWVKEEIAAKVSTAERGAIEHPGEVRRRYLLHVQDSCKWLDFRGLMVLPELFFLRLTDIYVSLYVMVARSEELFKHLALRARARYLAEEVAAATPEISLALRRELADEMRRLAATVERQRVDAREVLEHPRLVILGDPGSGKTTFLRYLALTFAEGREAAKQRLGFEAEWLPILLPIDAYAAALRVEPELSLTDYLPRYFASRELDLPELSAYFRQELAAGRCLVLLDGLDTVIDSAERLRVARRVEAFINRHAGNRFVITSRIEGYREAPLLGDYLHCTASDLEMPEVEQFAHQWSLACEIQVADMPERRFWAEVQASRLIEAIKAAPGVRRLTGNPLLLTLVALVHRQGRLPRHRIALYSECARTLIERWNRVRSTSMQPVGLPMDVTEAFRNFGPLALWMHEEKRRGTVSGDELEGKLRELLVDRGLPEKDATTTAYTFLEMERNQTGLLVERGVNAYGFFHLTFQEYFAARAIAVEETPTILERLRAHLHDPRWREVILLTVGQIGIRETKEKAVTYLVQSIANSHSPLEEVLHRDLLLAGRCLADDVGIGYRQRSELLNRLLDLWHAAQFDQLRREITGVLSAMRGTASEPQTTEALLADLDSGDPEGRAMAADALGRMGMTSDSVLDALTEALRTDKRPRVRAHAALALSGLNVAPEQVFRALDDALRDDSEREVRLRAAEALAYIGQENDQAIDLLLSALEDRDGNVRGSAAAALTSLRKPSERLINALLRALQDSRVDVRTNAADILGRLGQRSERAIEGLLEVLRDPYEDARICAAMALGQVGDTSNRVVQALIERLADDSRVVRKNAAAALGKLAVKADNVIKALEKALQDERTGVGAADALGRAGRADLSIASVAERQLQADEWWDRIRAVEALTSLDKEGQASQKVIETLADVLHEERRMGWEVLAGTAITLSEVARRSDEALSMVVRLLESESWVVRTAAAEALGLAEKATPEVIQALIRVLKEDKDDHARGNAATALGTLGISTDEVIDILVGKLGDFNGYVRVAVADALSKLGVRSRKKVLDGLLKLLDDGYYSHYHDKYVRDAAFDALWVLAPYSAAEPIQ
jgi:HEAT repeat protein/tRNA A37 threonylcarbamoyladenosine biosynthesis protein TsaE